MKEYIAKAAALASAAYPNWNPTRATLEAWSTLLADVPGPELVQAMAAHCRTSEFPPTVASLLSRARSLSGPAETVGILAWAEVHQAIKDGGRREPWSHEHTREALQSLGGFYSVSDCQTSQIPSLRAKFCEAYDALVKRAGDEMEREVLRTISSSGNLGLDAENKSRPALE